MEDSKNLYEYMEEMAWRLARKEYQMYPDDPDLKVTRAKLSLLHHLMCKYIEYEEEVEEFEGP